MVRYVGAARGSHLHDGVPVQAPGGRQRAAQRARLGHALVRDAVSAAHACGGGRVRAGWAPCLGGGSARAAGSCR